MKKYKCNICPPSKPFITDSRKKIRKHVQDEHSRKSEKHLIQNAVDKKKIYQSPVKAAYTVFDL